MTDQSFNGATTSQPDPGQSDIGRSGAGTPGELQSGGKEIVLERHGHILRVLPGLGGAVTAWQKNGLDVFRPVGNAALRAQKHIPVGAYPLFPYSNRIENGEFSFGGRHFQLRPNMEDSPHPIHGNAWEQCWQVEHQTHAHLVLSFDHLPGGASGDEAEQRRSNPHWPFAYRAVLSYSLHPDGLEVGLVIENRDNVEQPVGFGFHPFLAMGKGARLSFAAKTIWLNNEDGLPVTEKPCRGEWSFKPGKNHEEEEGEPSLFVRQIDNVFTGFGGKARLEEAETGRVISVEASPIFGNLVVFTPAEADFVALEPVTNLTNAINTPLLEQQGLHVLKPGARIGGKMFFRVEKL